ncbi:MAG: fluoride efflux transporter CrcB [Cyclobacteriaceae bacterium]|nr:fluoride efflux transporter CrcB [Cyclobacteriaceae bacterium]
MKPFLLIFLGGGIGSVARFALGRWVNVFHSSSLPLGTLTVNVVACLLLGFIIGLADHRQVLSASARIFWTVGFCGGFSTFSTFSHDNLDLLQQGFTFSLFLNIALSLLLCLGASYLGLWLGKSI